MFNNSIPIEKTPVMHSMNGIEPIEFSRKNFTVKKTILHKVYLKIHTISIPKMYMFIFNF